MAAMCRDTEYARQECFSSAPSRRGASYGVSYTLLESLTGGTGATIQASDSLLTSSFWALTTNRPALCILCAYRPLPPPVGSKNIPRGALTLLGLSRNFAACQLEAFACVLDWTAFIRVSHV